MDLLRGAALVAATMTTGLVAGVFGLYAHTIMPGLRRTDDRTFVAAFQSIRDRGAPCPAGRPARRRTLGLAWCGPCLLRHDRSSRVVLVLA
ncbi:MAG TPA: hypothetical protein VFA46_04120 [Actinomycetes bacterium]|jgi:hypothetical protein|nr:hypothetical protein [Actinomycetes bacterium]